MPELFKRSHQIVIIFIEVFYRLSPLFGLPVGSHLVQNVHFVVCSFKVVLGAFLHFDRHVAVVFEIFSEPHGRKVTPTELLNYNVPVDENLADVNWVVSAQFVVGHAFIFTGITIIEKRFI